MTPLTFWTGQFSVVQGYPMHCRMFSTTAGLYPLKQVALPNNDDQKCLQTLSSDCGGQKLVPPTHTLC